MSELVSVIIPTFNRAVDLTRALGSLRAQTYTNWEAVVVDNESTDGTGEMVAQLADPRVTFLSIRNNGVIAASRNKGLREARGNYVGFLDSDDYWTPAKLELSVSWLDRGFDVVYHDLQIVSPEKRRWRRRLFATRQVTPPVYRDLLVNGNTIPTSSVVARKSVVLAVSGFSERPSLIAGEDYDMWLRVAALDTAPKFKRLEGVHGYLSRDAGGNEHGPRRLPSILREIEENHLPKLSEGDREEVYSRWLDYFHGRTFFQQGKIDEARTHLRRVARRSPSLSLRLKALYMLAVSSLGYQK